MKTEVICIIIIVVLMFVLYKVFNRSSESYDFLITISRKYNRSLLEILCICRKTFISHIIEIILPVG